MDAIPETDEFSVERLDATDEIPLAVEVDKSVWARLTSCTTELRLCATMLETESLTKPRIELMLETEALTLPRVEARLLIEVTSAGEVCAYAAWVPSHDVTPD